jgi:hypothetical protein
MPTAEQVKDEVSDLKQRLQDAYARDYINAMKAGKKPEERPDVGEFWEDVVEEIERKYQKFGGNAQTMAGILDDMCRQHPALADLLKVDVPPARDGDAYPELPEAIKQQEALWTEACHWLDAYIAFSKKWSPRGYESYHEATGIALLSTVAARRVAFPFGQMEYTPFFILLVGESTLYRKTTTANVYDGLLYAAKLDWLLGANITTPQKLLTDMAGYSVPKNYGKLDAEGQELVRKRLAMPAQRGWYYDEFGMHLDQMVREGGTMADFKGLLRILDDCKPTFSTATQTRGTEKIEKPYLSLLASLTPVDLKPYAEKGSKFWRDGLFPRFSFVCPPMGAKGKRDRFPIPLRVYPKELVEPLKAWHTWLGEAEIEITQGEDKQGEPDGNFTINRIRDLPERVLESGEEILDALYAYENALLDMVEEKRVPDALSSSYGRLHKIALRVAMLLASFEARDNQDENYGGRIEMRHWARGQRFAEERRRDLHELYAQVNVAEGEGSMKATIEDDIERHLRTHGALTLNTLRNSYMKKRSTEEVANALKFMKRRGAVEEFSTSGGWVKFKLTDIAVED